MESNIAVARLWYRRGKEEYFSIKQLIEKLDFKKSVSGGDHNASRMWLVNIRKLFTSDVFKTFEGLDNDKK